jgi:hypothetical protein
MAERVTFDRTLYLPEAVEAAAEAYAGYATIRLMPSAAVIDVDVSDPIEHDLQTILDGFCNHVLHETISRRRQADLGEVG